MRLGEPHNHICIISEKMEKVRVDLESRQVVLLDVLNAAITGLHRQGTSRVLGRVLEKYDGTQPSKMRVNSSGNPNIVGTLGACMFLLDNIPGEKWDKWRQECGTEFKDKLTKHVGTGIKSTTGPTITPVASKKNSSMDVHSESDSESTKTQLMQKHLQVVNIVGYMRIDEKSGLASAIDVIRMTNPEVNPRYAGVILTRLLRTDDRVPSLRSRVEYRKVNGVGHITPLTDVKTLLEILWTMPGAGGRKYRRTLSKVLCRVMGGDITLCDEIEETNRVFQSTAEGKAVQRALGEPVTFKEDSRKVRESSVRDNLAKFHHASTEVWTPSGVIDVLTDKEVIEVKYYRKWQRGMGQVLAYGSHYPERAKRLHLFAHKGDERLDHFFTQAKSVCEEYGVQVTREDPIVEDESKRPREAVDHLHNNEILIGRVKKAKPTSAMPFWFEYASAEEKSAYVSAEARRSTMETEMGMIVTYKNVLETARPLGDREKMQIRECFRRITSGESTVQTHSSSQLQRSIDPSTGLPLATPKCPLSVRGSETTIPLEAGKLGIRVEDRSGLVGTEMKKLYGIRYGADAARDVPKRTTLFRGQPLQELGPHPACYS